MAVFSSLARSLKPIVIGLFSPCCFSELLYARFADVSASVIALMTCSTVSPLTMTLCAAIGFLLVVDGFTVMEIDMNVKVFAVLFVLALAGCEGLKSDIRALCDDPLTARGERICSEHVR